MGDTNFGFLANAPLIFAGHQLDEEIGLYDARARLLDPSTGRFLTQDPARSGSNLYRYVAGDPTNNVDPNGQFLVTGSLLTLATIGTLVARQSLFNAAADFDEAGTILGQAALTSSDVARFNDLVQSARTQQAFGEVLGFSSIALASGPALGFVGTGIASLPAGGLVLGGLGVVGGGLLISEGASIASAYASGQIDGIEASRRAGVLVGPVVTGGLGAGLSRSSLGRSIDRLGFELAAPLLRGAPSLIRQQFAQRAIAFALQGEVGSAITLAASQGAFPAGLTANRTAGRLGPLLAGEVPGINITPLSTANRFPTIGRGARTFLTDLQAFEGIIGPLTGTRVRISGPQAASIESALGLRPGSLEARNIISIVDDIPLRSPGLPVTGNALFLGGGRGLPSGAPELTISGIGSAGGGGVRQIILEVAL